LSENKNGRRPLRAPASFRSSRIAAPHYAATSFDFSKKLSGFQIQFAPGLTPEMSQQISVERR